jgi:hypothetical protein
MAAPGRAGMKNAKTKTAKKTPRKAPVASRGSRKPVDLAGVRRQITNLVGNQALSLVKTTIGEASKGHYAAMKYLFELIGLYPATGQETPQGEETLARTLLRRMGVPEDSPTAEGVTKDCGAEAAENASHTVE